MIFSGFRNRICKSFAGLLLLVLASGLQASPVKVNQAFEQLVLGKSLEYYEDKAGTLDRAGAEGAPFQPVLVDKPSFGYTKSVYWLRFSIDNDTDEDIPLILELVSLVDSITIHTEKYGEWQTKKTGRLNPVSTRDIPHRNFLFEINAAPGNSWVYLRFQSDGTMLLPLTLLSPRAFQAKNDSEQLIFGGYFGILIALAMYNLFLYFATRDRSYVYYVLYVLSFALLQSSIWGFLPLAFPDYPILVLKATVPIIAATIFFVTAFALDFLSVRKGVRYTTFRIMQFAAILLAIGSFALPYRIAVQIAVVFGFVNVIALFIGAVIAVRTFKPARYFLLAFGALFLGVVGITLRNLGFFSFNAVSSYSGQIGSVMEVILLSLALADRINALKAEKDLAQKQALETQKKMAESFSRFVPREFLEMLEIADITAVNPGDAVQKELTVLFADIRGFTTLSEKMNPQENFQFINAFLRRIGPVIRQYGGFIDKYIGDAVMALFDDSEKAVHAAVATLEALDTYNDERMAHGFIPIVLGIGIHTGRLMLGIIGEEKRIEGTVISDSVNTAARIESLTRQYGAEILVSEAVASRTHLVTRYIGEVQLRGKAESIKIFSIPRHGIGEGTNPGIPGA